MGSVPVKEYGDIQKDFDNPTNHNVFSVITYNIQEPPDSPENFVRMEEAIATWIIKNQPAIMLTQEIAPNHCHEVKKQVKKSSLSYDFVYQGSVGPTKENGSCNAIFFNTYIFENIGDSYFDLHVNGEKCPRNVIWTQLKHKKSGKTFLVINTHWDHNYSDEGIRIKEAEKMVREIKKIVSGIEKKNNRKIPLIIGGDFNASSTRKSIKILVDGLSLSEKKVAGIGSFIGWEERDRGYHIDHIFCKNCNITTYKTLNNAKSMLSDHLPLLAFVQ